MSGHWLIRGRWQATLGLCMVWVLAACSGESDGPTASAPAAVGVESSQHDGVEWTKHGGTDLEQRFGDIPDINTQNVQRLGLAWFADFDTHRGQESTPLMVNGVLYVTTAWSKVYAFRAATGEQLWMFDPAVPGGAGIKACCDVVNRGAAYDSGRVFVGTVDGRLIALDAVSGKPIWSTQTVDPSQPYTITGAPRVAKGKVFIGNGGAEYGVRGYVSAYAVETGELAWRFYTVPGDPQAPADGVASDTVLRDKALPTWHGTEWVKFGGGGTVWDSIVYDPELDQLYIGTGNGSPWNRQDRSQGQGDNLFVSSIVALNPDTGAYLWHYQETPGDTWDYTATQQITLATLTLKGERRQVIMHAPKNGFFYVFDRVSGDLLSAEKITPVNWAERIDLETGRPVETAGARFESAPFLSTSGGAGAHNWQPMSYSPLTGLVYIPAQQVPFLYAREKDFVHRPGEWNLGVDLLGTPLPLDAQARQQIVAGLQGRLIAWDPVEQKAAWQIEHAAPWNGGTLATAGGLVFQGLTDHTFRAFDATNGAALWQFSTQDAVITAPVTYRVDGTQYIAVTVGNGGGMPLTLPTFDGPKATPNGRLLVFALDGKAQLPPFVPVAREPVVVDGDLPVADESRAFALFGRYCAACHGIETLSAGVLPDLRYSAATGNPALWRSVVVDGLFESKGMVGFGSRITADDAELIRRYVGVQARRLASSAQTVPES